MTRLTLLLGAVALIAGCGADSATPQGDPVAGARIAQEVADPPCGSCHTLAAAEFEGRTAPNLDDLDPGYQRVLRAVRTGPGVMPSYDDELDDAELHHVAAYISEAAGR